MTDGWKRAFISQAISLYEQAGFVRIPPFGPYTNDRLSLAPRKTPHLSVFAWLSRRCFGALKPFDWRPFLRIEG